METKVDELKFSCELCGNIFQLKKSLTRHVKLKHSSYLEKFRCDVCNMTFSTMTARGVHVCSKKRKADDEDEKKEHVQSKPKSQETWVDDMFPKFDITNLTTVNGTFEQTMMENVPTIRTQIFRKLQRVDYFLFVIHVESIMEKTELESGVSVLKTINYGMTSKAVTVMDKSLLESIIVDQIKILNDQMEEKMLRGSGYIFLRVDKVTVRITVLNKTKTGL